MRATRIATARLADNPITMSQPADPLLAETRRVASGVGDGIRGAEGGGEGVMVGVNTGATLSTVGVWITLTGAEGDTAPVGVPGSTMAAPGVDGVITDFVGVAVGRAAPCVGEGEPLGIGVPVSVTTPVAVGVAGITNAPPCIASLTVSLPPSAGSMASSTTTCTVGSPRPTAE